MMGALYHLVPVPVKHVLPFRLQNQPKGNVLFTCSYSILLSVGGVAGLVGPDAPLRFRRLLRAGQKP